MATTKITVPSGSWIEIMDISATAFGIVKDGRIRWKRDGALPTDPLDEASEISSRETQIDASATQKTYGTSALSTDAIFILNDD